MVVAPRNERCAVSNSRSTNSEASNSAAMFPTVDIPSRGVKQREQACLAKPRANVAPTTIVRERMPAYPTHSFFSHLALQALIDGRQPLAEVAARHDALFRVAGIAGCDIQ